MTWREIDAENLKTLRNQVIIDVRSPCEFEVERIPTAINIPLLTDSERAKVGTVYAQRGEVVARRLGLKFIAPKIPEIVDRIVELKHRDTSLVIHCWRGGLRSEAVASFLSIVGIDCWRLSGGYKSWRNMVLKEFERDQYLFDPVILQGRTGTGKTELLHLLEKSGAQILDLEGLAHHRGSLFGELGLDGQPTQKNFDGALWKRLQDVHEGPLFIEAEGRKIGNLNLPEFVMRRINTGKCILVTSTTSTRVDRLLRSYLPETNVDLVAKAKQILPLLTAKLGKQMILELNEYADRGEFSELVEKLLVNYYDPLYDGHILKQQPYALEVCSDHLETAAAAIMEWSNKRCLV
jgi:tRNA 2-selenouridine synthase